MLEIFIIPLLQVLLACLSAYDFMIFVYIILSWLLAFNILNRGSAIVFAIYNFLARIIEPVLTPLRRLIPTVGFVDFSPIILCICLSYLSRVLRLLILKYFPG